MKSKTSIGIIALLLIATMLVSGCVDTVAPEEPEAEEKAPITPEPEEPEEEEPEEEPECITNTDCDDGNECTTDSCSNGVCKYTKDVSCEEKEYKAASIKEVEAKDSDEYIVLNGQDEYIANWKLTLDDEQLIKFPLGRWLYGDLTIHMGSGIGTTIDLYMGNTEPVIGSGDVVKLINDDGDVVEELIVP